MMNQCSLRSYTTGECFSVDEVVYRDSQHNLLEVHHDLDVLKKTSPSEWKNLFKDRCSQFSPLAQSGVWSKKEWVLPYLAEADIVTLQEGWSSLLSSPSLSKDFGVENLKIKLCGNSHTGSFKDLGMTALVSHVKYLIRKGENIRAIACASTGDTSAALAAYCAAAQIPSVVFLPTGKITTAQLIQPISNGSLVILLDTDFDGCMKIVQQVSQDKSIYLANSMNPLRIEGQKTIAFEICQQMNWNVPDILIIPGGNLGNVSALGRGFDMLLDLGIVFKKPKIVVAQTEQANPLYQAYKTDFKVYKSVQAKKTLASAIQIGDPVSYARAIRTLKKYDGMVFQVSEEQLANAAHLADRSGFYCCPHTGVALGALQQMVENKQINSNDSVVVISTAHGLKFSEFKINYHNPSIPNMSHQYHNSMVECKANIDAVQEVLLRNLKQ